MSMDTTFLRRHISTLEIVLEELAARQGADKYADDMYFAACDRAFGLVLEQSGKLLRKRLAAFFASNRQADRLTFRDLFRHAAKHGLIDTDAVERWFDYRDHRNVAEDEHGENFAESTLKLLPSFIADAKGLAEMIEDAPDD